MARRPRVKTWLSEVELLEWTRQATTPAECRRRLAVWITTLHGWPAHEVARLLGVSKQAIWAWMGQYNRLGPEGLDREGRGGRRWAFLSWEQEERLLASMRAEALEGRVMTAKHVYARVCETAKREVSLGYVYRLMHRHDWRKLSPRPRHVQADPQAQAEFKKNSRKPSKKR